MVVVSAFVVVVVLLMLVVVPNECAVKRTPPPPPVLFPRCKSGSSPHSCWYSKAAQFCRGEERRTSPLSHPCHPFQRNIGGPRTTAAICDVRFSTFNKRVLQEEQALVRHQTELLSDHDEERARRTAEDLKDCTATIQRCAERRCVPLMGALSP